MDGKRQVAAPPRDGVAASTLTPAMRVLAPPPRDAPAASPEAKKRGPRASWRGDLARPVRDDGSGAYFGIAGVRPVFAPHGFAGFGWAGIGTAQVSFFFHTHWPSRTQICFDSVLYSAGTGMSL